MSDLIRAVIARLIGAGIGAVAGYLAAKGVPSIDATASQQLTQAVTGGVMLAGYAIAHRLFTHVSGSKA